MGLSHPGSQRQVLPKGISAGLTRPRSHVSRPDPKMLVKGSVKRTKPKGVGETDPVPWGRLHADGPDAQRLKSKSVATAEKA